MSTLQPGDLLLLQADTVDETVEWIKNFVAQLAEKKQAAELASETIPEPLLEAEPTTAAKETRQTAEINASVLANATSAAKG